MNKCLLSVCLSLLCTLISINAAEQNKYQIKIIEGNQTEKIIPFLVHMFLTYFREYPYLYHWTFEQEHSYVTKFMTYKDAAVALVYCNEKPVGLLTGTSVISFENDYGNNHGIKETFPNASNFYYFGEVIVMPEHRRKGLATSLFKEFESWAIAHGYTHGCFMSESHETHPLKPHDYKSPDTLWHALGYKKSTILITPYVNTFQPDGSSHYQTHYVPYWIKEFKP